MATSYLLLMITVRSGITYETFLASSRSYGECQRNLSAHYQDIGYRPTIRFECRPS
jgi:hypothetical protein